jgi:adenylate cyclase
MPAELLLRIGRGIWRRIGHRGRLAGILALLVLVFVRYWSPTFIEVVWLRYFDLLQRLEPRPVTAFPVVIVDIDEASLAEIGQWPWPRTTVARMVDRLMADGAVAIGFDMVFSEADRTSPEMIAKQIENDAPSALVGILQQLPSNDVKFAMSLRKAHAVLGEVAVASGGAPAEISTAIAKVGGDPAPFVFQYGGLIANIPVLAQAAMGHGAFSLAPDVDDVVRRVPGILRIGEVLHPSLAVDLLRVATGQRAIAVKVDAAGVNSIVVAGVSIPTDEHGRIWVRYGPHDPRRFVGAADVLAGRVDPKRIAGKLVLVGASAAGLSDIRTSPVAKAMPGVEIHAQLLETVLTQQNLVRPNYALGLELAVVLFAGLVLVIVVPRLGARWTILVPLAVAAAMTGASWFAFVDHGFLIDPTYPTAAAVLIYLALAYAGYVVEERARKEVKFQFGHYVSPIVVERLARDRNLLRLGGETRDLSVMFCDLRGFTTLSERFKGDPEGLTQLINRFLNAVSKSVRDFDGTLDKYIGDSMMAFWNAPLDDADHAQNACRAALAMRVALDELNVALAAEQGGDAAAEVGSPGATADPAAWRQRIESEARQGVAQAQYQLGKLYRDGIARRKDRAQAVKWFRAAAEQGDPRAQRNLGSRYARGDGVPRSDREALFWLTLASQESLTAADEERREIEARMHGAEVAAIEERVRLWRPTPGRASGIRLEMGVGINSGVCLVGNLGSDYLFNYSVLGDPVNLASRLEGQTRNYGIGVLVSESTAAGASDLALLELDLIAVKGKEDAVRIYGLLGDAAFAASPACRSLVEVHARFLAAYRAQNWSAARAAMTVCLDQELRFDELYELYQQRIAIYERDPPGPDWNGVFYAQTK